MILGCIADDLTGASDIASTLAKEGIRTVQLMGMPSDLPEGFDAAVVALRTRSIPVGDATRESLTAVDWLRRRGCDQFVFKYCSTFDSTPAGNIGPVAVALAAKLNANGVVVCPAFPDAGRTLYRGHLFVGDKLLNESGMEQHPVNPMTDPDIRRWLRRQVDVPIGHVAIDVVERGVEATNKALRDQGAAGNVLVVVDATSNRDLRCIGAACRDARLVTGASGVALGLPENLFQRGLPRTSRAPSVKADGFGAVLCGSCSSATLSQVASHAAEHPTFAVDVDSLLTDRIRSDAIADCMIRRRADTPLLYSSARPSDVSAVQARYGPETVAAKLSELFGDVARRLVGGGFRRLVVAGGETSGAVVSALGLVAFEIGTEVDLGVPVLQAVGTEPPLALVLKSGNLGAPDIFARAMEMLGVSQ